MALVVVSHLEHFRRRLLAFRVSLAQFLIDNDLHLIGSPFSLPTEYRPANRSYKRAIRATRSVEQRISKIGSAKRARIQNGLPGGGRRLMMPAEGARVPDRQRRRALRDYPAR